MKPLHLFSMLIFAALAGCAAVMSVGSDFDQDTDFSGYRTFAWEMTEPVSTGDPRLDDNPFFDSRVRAAVEKELAGKDIEPAAGGNPDLLMHYHMFVEHRERLDIYRLDKEIDEPHGYSIFEKPVEMRVNPYDEGTLLIDAADAGTRHIIWRGWAKLDVTDVLDSRKQLDKRIQEAVARIIKRFPTG
jgi:hypothetical protein